MKVPTAAGTDKYRERIEPGDRRKLVASVLKAGTLVDAFLAGPPEVTLAELARRTGYPSPTVHRLLATLDHVGWVSRGESGGYRLSLYIVELAQHVLSGINLREQSLAPMQELTHRTGETAYLVVRGADHVVFVERIESFNMVRVMSWDVGSTLPLYAGGAALALLAHTPAEERDRLLGDGPLELPIGAQMSREALEERLRGFRATGVAVSSEEIIPGIAAVGAPVFGPDGHVAAAVSIGGLTSTIMGERLDSITEAVREAGRVISTRIGFHGTYPPTID
jgi:IclR family transcriptional regulator, KDG regulon repressor